MDKVDPKKKAEKPKEAPSEPAKVEKPKETKPAEKAEEKKELKVEELCIAERLFIIQQELQAPKGQFNKFGGYAYRSCEDILGAVKPLLKKTKTILTIQDEIVPVGERVYVRALARLKCVDRDEFLENFAFAREEESKKGMDGSQVTGASSSYARKYALNGLFGIDDTKDSDATNDHGRVQAKQVPKKPATPPRSPELKAKIGNALKLIAQKKTMDEFKQFKQSLPEKFANVPEVKKALVEQYRKLENEMKAEAEKVSDEDAQLVKEAEEAFANDDGVEEYKEMFE